MNSDKELYLEIHSLIFDYFNGDLMKAYFWFRCHTPVLGGLAPDEMIALGRVTTLHAWIKSQLDGNLP